MKKIIGIFSIILAGFALWSGIRDENPTMWIHVALFLATGIFLVTYDLIYKKSYLEGFRAMKTKSIVLIILLVAWVLFFLMMCIGALLASSQGAFSTIAWFSTMIFLIPGLYLLRVFDLHSPYRACKKYFLTSDEIAKQYLGNDSEFVKYSQNDFVFASRNGLLFRKSFCFIPFNQIVSIDSKSTIDGATVIFTFNNGKKLKMLTKQYDDIVAAMNSANQ